MITAERSPAALALGSLAGCALVALVDPGQPGRYPLCPTRALLGLDCPACGTLRGLHALSRGQLGVALDHNLLLLLAVPLGALIWARWTMAALGRTPRPIATPRWAIPAIAVVAIAFALVRNVAGGSWAWLDSAA